MRNNQLRIMVDHIWIFRYQCHYASMPLALCKVCHGSNGVTYFRLCGRFFQVSIRSRRTTSHSSRKLLWFCDRKYWAVSILLLYLIAVTRIVYSCNIGFEARIRARGEVHSRVFQGWRGDQGRYIRLLWFHCNQGPFLLRTRNHYRT